MSPLNGLMNHVAELAGSEVCFTRTVSTRAATILGGIPLEILSMLQNVILLPFQPVGVTLKVVVKVCNFCINSQILRDVEDFLPGLGQIFITAYKIFAYAFGTVFTATLGLISPMSNFRLHCALGLIHDEKAEAERIQTEEEEARQRELHEAVMQAQIQTMLFEIRQKAAEQERLRDEEAQKEKEAQAALSKLAKTDEGKKQGSVSVRFIQDNLVKDPVNDAKQQGSSPSQTLQHANEQLLQEVKRSSVEAKLNEIIPQGRMGMFRKIKSLFSRVLVHS